MQPSSIDPTLLRSFCAVAETGSFTRAAQGVHLTQSTVSQQIRRLEEQMGCTLLDRSGRHVECTLEGERLLAYAQRILALMDEAVEQLAGATEAVLRIGVPEDFAGNALMPALGALARSQPQLRLELTSGLSQAIWQQLQAGELDLAIVKQRSGSTPGMARWPEPLAWIDSARHPCHGMDPLPLVVFPQGGLYRSEMTHALDAAGRRWRLAYVSASLASLEAAVEQGLGISLLPRRLVGSGHRLLDGMAGFAPVPDVEVALHVRAQLSAPGRRLAERLCEVCEALLSPAAGEA